MPASVWGAKTSRPAVCQPEAAALLTGVDEAGATVSDVKELLDVGKDTW